ncbi:MAG: PilT/PilU family type 4a pilus ATPase [Candidatus Krumholzibacteria bacterium]|jgi:twitching motility protein PilT|nr:PilT/PilU family type 4a pilus ATPase [Candidatus Krumholzibacteria bacterium]
MNIKAVLESMITKGGSDLHLKAGLPPVVRVDGRLVHLDFDRPGPKDMEDIADQILTPSQKENFRKTREVDFAFGVAGLARFRANFYVQRGSIAMVFRHVPVEIKSLDELSLPETLKKLSLKQRGLIFVTGTVGSGKSTTLAAMVREINETANKNIITVEDPIEFLHHDIKSIVNQREIGTDTSSFHEALRHILRQDPDVILVGEIRDALTMEIALMAADTGHLVFSTLHTIDAMQTINRVISFFPPHQHQEIRYLLASTLQAVVAQRLIPLKEGKGRAPAVEVMVVTSAIREYIIDPEKAPLIQQAIREGVSSHGMQSFDQSLMKLLAEGRISMEEALKNSSNPHEFSLRLKGIQASSDKTWDTFESAETSRGTGGEF